MKILLLFISNSIYIEAGKTRSHKQNLFHPAIARDKEHSENKTESIASLEAKLSLLEEERKNTIQLQKYNKDAEEKLKKLNSEIRKLEKKLKN